MGTWLHRHKVPKTSRALGVGAELEFGVNSNWPVAWIDFTFKGRDVSVHVILPSDDEDRCCVEVVVDEEETLVTVELDELPEKEGV